MARIAGFDDTAKMPVTGSIFWAVVVCEEEDNELLRSIGVKDSKELTRHQRERLFEKIRVIAQHIDFIEITPTEIDDKTRNLNHWCVMKLAELMLRTFKKVPVERMYIDNMEHTEAKFRQRFHKVITEIDDYDDIKGNFGFGWRKVGWQDTLEIIEHDNDKHQTTIIAEHGADSKFPVCSAASIVAKCLYDWQMDNYRQIYPDIGSGNPGDPKTEKWITEHKEEPIIRKSWKTYKNATKGYIHSKTYEQKRLLA